MLVQGQGPIFTITDTKYYVPVVTLSTQVNEKLLEQLKSSFNRTISWSKYQPKITMQVYNRYLGFWIDPSLKGVNKPFVLSFEQNISMFQIVTSGIFFQQ